MGELVDLQHSLYAQAAMALHSLASSGPKAAPALIAAAFALGALHALMPGHGKAVMTSRFVGAGTALEAIGTTCVLILVHVGSAVVIAWGGFTLIKRTIGGAGRAPALEAASQTLIVIIGLWLLWRAFRPHHDHREGSSLALGVAAGLVPCPLTFFTMSYAIPRGLFAAGLVLTAGFAAGMIVTVAALPLLAVVFRSRLRALMPRTQRMQASLAKALSIGAALAVILLGTWPAIRA